jgi:hypothetical protein
MFTATLDATEWLIAGTAAGALAMGVGVCALIPRAWGRWLATAAVFVGGLGLAASLSPVAAAVAAPVALGLIGALALFGSGAVRMLQALCARPAARGLGTAALGLAMIAAAAIQYDRADNALDVPIEYRPPLEPGLNAATDRGQPIALMRSIAPRPAAELEKLELSKFQDSAFCRTAIRRGKPDDHSNCHGWVFTGGQFWLLPEMIPTILADNQYARVTDPQPGDLVIYYSNREIAHTGIVRYTEASQPPIVESKWGSLGVFIHTIHGSVYGNEYQVYRSPRRGHRLDGISPGV